MIGKKISFKSFEGETQTTTEYFNLNRRELLSIAAKYAPQTASLEGVAKTLTENGDLQQQLNFMDDVILSAYGRRDADGIVFQKTQAIRDTFKNSVVYDVLFNELLENEDEMKKFIAGVPQENISESSVKSVKAPNSVTD